MDINSLYIQKQIDETTMWQPVDDLIKYDIKCEKILDNDKYKFDLYIDYRNQFETYVTYIKLIDYINNKNKDKIKLFISDNTNYLKIICDEKNIMILNKKKIIFEPQTLIKYCSFDYIYNTTYGSMLIDCKKCVNDIHCEMDEPGFMDYILGNKKVIDEFNEFFIAQKNSYTVWYGTGANISCADNTANFKNYIFLLFITGYNWYKKFVLYLNYLNSSYNIRYIIPCPILENSTVEKTIIIPAFQITITNDVVPIFKEYNYVINEFKLHSERMRMQRLNDLYGLIKKKGDNLEIICVLSPLAKAQNVIIYRQDINI